MSRASLILLFLGPLLLAACGDEGDGRTLPVNAETNPILGSGLERATFGAGCFWCVEAVFQELKGVSAVHSGYMGGALKDPSYEAICSGTTGHAEVIQVTYDPGFISFSQLLEVFWKSHDPTTLNRQGADTGTQYRSAVFHHDDEQRSVAESLRTKLDDSGAFSAPIVTEVVPAGIFYEAEGYHQDYYARNAAAPYCRAVIQPKLEKFRQVFGALRK